MKPAFLLTAALLFSPVANSWAQGTDEADIPGDSLMVNMADYGLLYQDEHEENRDPSQMPIYNPQLYEDKGFIWSPSDKWLYHMPVIGTQQQDSPDQKKDK